jgi:trans-2,3-dihydro-3-hydroxyanthranilate isomerase
MGAGVTRSEARRYRFRQVDVFTDRPLQGNALAVFPDAEGLSDDEMQALALEMNVSETCFVLPPTAAGTAEGADYRVRIFTPGRELPFAGHPAIGTAWVLADERRITLDLGATQVRQEVAIGVLPLRIDVREDGPERARRPAAVTMTQGTAEVLTVLEPEDIDELCEALEVSSEAIGWPDSGPSAGAGRSRTGRRRSRWSLPEDGESAATVAPAIISTGLPHLIIPFLDRAVMADVERDRREYVAEICQAYDCDSAALVGPGNSGTIADADVSVRIFDSDTFRIDADPATGAAAGPIAVFLGMLQVCRDRTFRLIVEQGVELARPSRLVAEVDFGADGAADEVRVSGGVVPVIEGWVTLP